MAEEKYNLKNPAVKRILQEVKEMHANPSDDFTSLPLEPVPTLLRTMDCWMHTSILEKPYLRGSDAVDNPIIMFSENIFEWQFAIRGPHDTEFEGGIYHGRIQLPAEYPFQPPSFMLLTPNGRFETQTKICLSISNHHPEHWQPSWSVRTALVALIAFMPTDPNGALGSLDYKKEERRALAIKSRDAAPKYGTPDRQRLINEIHQFMLSKAPPVPQISPQLTSGEPSTNIDGESEVGPQDADALTADADADAPNPAADRIVADVSEVHVNANAGPLRVSFSAGLSVSRRVPATDPAEQQQLPQRPEDRVPKPADDRLFTWAAIGLTIAIVFLLLKKFLKSSGHDIMDRF